MIEEPKKVPPMSRNTPKRATRSRGPKQVLPDLPKGSYADVPKNVPHRYLSGEALERRRLYDAQRQRGWRAKQVAFRNSAAGTLPAGQPTMVVPSPAVETVVAPEPVAAPYQVTATSMEDLGEINAQRLSMMADVRNLSDQIARQRREAADLQDIITERLKQAAKLAGRS